MRLPLRFLLVSIFLFTVDAHADLEIGLTTADGIELHGSQRPDFVVTISNPDPDTINISKDWQNHTLIVDGQWYEIMQTMWWCMESPKLRSKMHYTKWMFLNYYQKLALKAGKHEIQFKLGNHLSNKMTITLEHDFKSTAGSAFSA